MHDGSFREGVLAQPFGGQEQFTHALHLAVHLEHTRVHNGTADLHHVAESGDDAVHVQRVAVGQREAVHLELLDGVDAVFLSGLAHEAYILRVGIARESSGKGQHALHALVRLHLVEHGSLDLSADFHQAVVGADDDDVVVLQAHVAGEGAVHQVVIDVDACQQLSAAIDLDVAQCTYFADASCEVEGVEGGGQAADGIAAGHDHFAQHLHLDGACLAHAERHAAVGIVLSELGFQATGGFADAESSELDGAHALDGHGAVGRDSALEALLRGSPDVDDDDVAGS